MHLLITMFKKYGWNYIYKLIITYFLFLKDSLLKTEDQAEFLMLLNMKNSTEYGNVWEGLINKAQTVQIDEKKG